jgi:hypothetical protein
MSGWDDEDVDDVAMVAPPTKSLTEQKIDELKLNIKKKELEMRSATGKEREKLRQNVNELKSLLAAEKEAPLTEAHRLETKKRSVHKVYGGDRKKRGGRHHHRKTRKVRKTRKSRV